MGNSKKNSREGERERERESQFSDGEGYVLPSDGNMDRPHSEISERGEKEKDGRPTRKRREKAKPLQVALDAGGDIPGGIC